MKNLFFIISFLFIGSNANCQTATEVKDYFNRGNMAIYKCQKELLRTAEPGFDVELREAMLLQLNAKAYYEKNDLSRSLKYSIACKNKCIAVFSKLKIANYDFFLDTPEEKKFTKDIDPSPLVNTNEAISIGQVKEVQEVDLKNPQAVRSIITNIN